MILARIEGLRVRLRSDENLDFKPKRKEVSASIADEFQLPPDKSAGRISFSLLPVTSGLAQFDISTFSSFLA